MDYDSLMENWAAFEDWYWWSLARQQIIQDLFLRELAGSNRVLDLGSGVGAVSAKISKYAEVCNTDISLKALEIGRQRGIKRLFQADCNKLPVRDAFFDIVLCLDVIEHIQRDKPVLIEIRRILNPQDGRLLLMVPAYQWLWTSRDDVADHHRRYSKKSLHLLLEECHFEIIFSSYINTLLFPFFLLDLLIDRIKKPRTIENYIPKPNKIINTLLKKIFSFERHFIPYPGLPFGVSLLCLCKPRND